MGSGASTLAAVGAPPAADAPSSAFDSMLGSELAAAKGETVDTNTALAGKVVALYFSAHWCPPCRGSTSKSAEWYTAHLQAKGLKVIFVPLDRDEEDIQGLLQRHAVAGAGILEPERQGTVEQPVQGARNPFSSHP